MDPTDNTTTIVNAAQELADTYAETQLWGVIAFFSVLVLVQFTAMVYMLVKKDHAYTSLINANAEVDRAVSETFDDRHKEFVDVLNRSIGAINKNSAALAKLSDKMGATDRSVANSTEKTREGLDRLVQGINILEQRLEKDDV